MSIEWGNGLNRSEQILQKAIADGKVTKDPFYSPYKIWVPVAMDNTIPNAEDKMQEIFECQHFEIQCLLRMGICGELCPSFTNSPIDYCTVHVQNVGFIILAIVMMPPTRLLIQIDPEKLKIHDDKVYIKNSGTELIFVPRMINYERIITFDAYPAGTKINWSRIRNCDTYPYPPLRG